MANRSRSGSSPTTASSTPRRPACNTCAQGAHPSGPVGIPMILKGAVEVVVSIHVLAAAVQENEARRANSQTEKILEIAKDLFG